jgi:hypothetical protein
MTRDRFEIYLSRSAEVTAEEINSLPEKLRRHIHDLATRSDPAGDIRTIASVTEQRDALALRVRELESRLKQRVD